MNIERKQQSGFILAELVIAICIVTASFAGVFALMNQCMRIRDDMKSEMLAVQAAESEIEQLRAMKWDSLIKLNSPFTMDPAKTSGLEELNSGKGEVLISTMPGDSEKKLLRTVSVRMTWNGKDGRSKEVALSTLITPHRDDQ